MIIEQYNKDVFKGFRNTENRITICINDFSGKNNWMSVM